ncbi:MAG: hypothetical protein ACOCSP_01465 [archaeon]
MEPTPPRSQWSRVAADPDPRTDLQYQMVDLDVIHVEGSETVVVLPNEADMLRENAFVVIEEGDLYDLEAWA